MLVDPWKVMLATFRKAFAVGSGYHQKRAVRLRKRAGEHRATLIETLEDRTLLAVSAGITGNNVAFQGTGGGPANAIVFTVDGSGNLEHNLGGQFGFNSNIDLDSATPGDQTRQVTALTSLSYVDQDPVGNDSVTFGADQFNFTNAGLLSINAGPITLSNNAQILLTATGGVNLTGAQGISLLPGSSITTQAGNITLAANQQATPSLASFIGIVLNEATITNNTGIIDLHGRGGVFGGINQGVVITQNSLVRGGDVRVTGEGGDGGNNVFGVLLDVSANVTSNGTGPVMVKGTGGGSGQNNYGVYLRNGGTIVSGGGDVHVIGEGGVAASDASYGVFVDAGGLISSGANGNVVVDATANGSGDDQYGIRVGFGGVITSGGGNVQVNGFGSDSGATNSFGVKVDQAGSRITAGGTGTVTVIGTGDGTDLAGIGVFLSDGGEITSTGGDVLVIGTGGTTSGGLNYGVHLDESGGKVSAGGTANVAITGTGGMSLGSENRGVSIVGANSTVTAGTIGDITIIGMGMGNDSTNQNYGIYIASDAQVRASGSGKLTMQGTGGGTGIENYGVLIDSAVVVAANGGLQVTGIEAADVSSLGIKVQNAGAALQSTGTGNIQLIADSMDFDPGVSISAGSQTVTLRPFNPGVAISIGGLNDSVGFPLALSDDELDLVTAGTLVIGDGNSGTVTVEANISRAAATNVLLISDANIVIDGGQFNTGGGTFAVDAGAGSALVRPIHTGVDVVASTVTMIGEMDVQIIGTTVDTQYTQFNITGAVNLTGAGLNVSGGYTFTSVDTLTIVSASSVTGTFNGFPDNSTFDFNGQLLLIRYTSNSVTLSLAPPNTPPTITSANAVNVDENTLVSTVILDVNATDSDLPPQTLTYGISGTDAALFSINTNTGEIRFLTSPDYEAPTDNGGNRVYDVIVTVSDGNGGSQNQPVTISINPLNDNAPVFSSLNIASVDENFSTLSDVLVVTATDADVPGQTLTYSITGGADALRFTINPATGQLRFVDSPDYENPNDVGGDRTYDVVVSADDGNGATQSQAVTINVLPVNDNLPVITSPLSATVNEEIPPATVVLNVDANDFDIPGQTVTYSLGGNDADKFTINTATGEIRFTVSPDFENPIDANTDNRYEFTVTANDGNGGLTTVGLTINVRPVNDNIPQFTSPTTANVDENTPPATVVLDINAIDADRPIQTITYSLFGDDAGFFSLDTSTGEVRFLNSPDYENAADFDHDNNYEISVFANDGMGESTLQTITISVQPRNDNSPIVTSATTAQVVSGTPATDVALNIDATDADIPVQGLLYSIGGTDSGQFSIDLNTGEIRFLTSPDFLSPTDAGGDNIYDLTVTVTDNLAPANSVTVPVQITVLSSNTAPVVKDGTLTLLEDIAAGGLLEASDVDVGDVLTFSIVTNPVHGVLTLLNALTGAYLYTPATDYNGPDSFTFKVNDTQADSNIGTIAITVTPVNDAPRFTAGGNQTVVEDSGSHTVPNWATGIAPGPATAIDEAGQALAFNVSNNNNGLFQEQPVVDAAGNLTYTLAADAVGVATVTVLLTDKGGTADGGIDTSAPQTFTIIVQGVNDTPVPLDATLSIRERSASSTVVGTVTVTDPDIGDTKRFSITAGNLGGTFAIDQNTGVITVANNALLDHDIQPVFTLTVQVRDQANAVGTATITINVRESLVIDFQSPPQHYVRGSGPIAIDPLSMARDADVPSINYNKGTLTVTILNPESGDRLGVLNQGNGPNKISVVYGNILYQSSLVIIGQIVSGTNGGPLVIKFTSYATEPAVDALLRAISFNSTSRTVHPGQRQIRFDLTNQSGDERDSKVKNITVAPVVTIPTFALPGGTLHYVSSSPPVAVALDGSAVVSEVSNLMGGRLDIVGGKGIKKQDQLTLLTNAGITVSGGNVSVNGQIIGRIIQTRTTLRIDFTTTAANTSAVQTLLRSVAFSSTSRKSAERIFTVSLSDGHGNSTTLNKTVDIGPG